MSAPPSTETPRPPDQELLEQARAAAKAVSPKVFWPSALTILAVVALAAVRPDDFNRAIQSVNTAVTNSLGWYYVLVVLVIVIFVIVLAMSRAGELVLGADDEEPEFGLLSWFAMLFAAGMGIGLVYWGAAEPLSHFASPAPGVEGDQAAVAQAAMAQTYLHWGLHPWALYVVVGLAIAYAVHRRNRPVSLRWGLEPVLGKHVHGFWGHLVDVIAVVGTVFGIATSLGFGVSQLSNGLEFLGVINEADRLLQVSLVIGITAIATLSVASGLGAGIKWLSNINLILAAALVVLLLIIGPTLFIFREFVQALGSYVQNFVSLSFQTLPFRGTAGEEWLGSWTTYYWGWWISWSPFVGVFIARISRGRTIREFVLGVLLVPALVTFLWFSVLGSTALYRQLFAEGDLITDGAVNPNTVLFQMLEGRPLAGMISVLFLVVLVIFFVTSSDSGSLVVDMIASGGNEDPPVKSRVFWAVVEGAVAGVLIWVGGGSEGGLKALQTLAILAALPLSVVLLMMCVSLAKESRADVRAIHRLGRARRQQEADGQIRTTVSHEVGHEVGLRLPEQVSREVSTQLQVLRPDETRIPPPYGTLGGRTLAERLRRWQERR